MLVPVQTACWEAWIASAMMVARSKSMRMLVAARPSYINPVLLAKMITTFDQLSGGRICINLIAGQSETENAAEGIKWGKEERYEIMDEEVSILKALWTTRGPVHFDGKFYQLKGAQIRPYPLQKPYPKFYLGGGSKQAWEISAKHSDVHLFWGDTYDRIRANMAEIKSMAAQHGRENEIGFGMRLQIVCRPTEKEAWEFAHGLVAHATEGQQAFVTQHFATSEANRRVRELAAIGETIEPHLWTGITQVRPGAGIAIVGDPEQCADTLQKFIDLGCHSFCLSGYLHDEEAERFGKWVMPILRERNRERMLAAWRPADQMRRATPSGFQRPSARGRPCSRRIWQLRRSGGAAASFAAGPDASHQAAGDGARRAPVRSQHAACPDHGGGPRVRCGRRAHAERSRHHGAERPRGRRGARAVSSCCRRSCRLPADDCRRLSRPIAPTVPASRSISVKACMRRCSRMSEVASPISVSAMSTSCPTSSLARRSTPRPSVPSCRRVTGWRVGERSAWPIWPARRSWPCRPARAPPHHRRGGGDGRRAAAPDGRGHPARHHARLRRGRRWCRSRAARHHARAAGARPAGGAAQRTAPDPSPRPDRLARARADAGSIRPACLPAARMGPCRLMRRVQQSCLSA